MSPVLALSSEVTGAEGIDNIDRWSSTLIRRDKDGGRPEAAPRASLLTLMVLEVLVDLSGIGPRELLDRYDDLSGVDGLLAEDLDHHLRGGLAHAERVLADCV